jgi:hypothetical protein
MEEAPSFGAVVQPDELIEAVVVLGDGRIGGVGFGDYTQLVVGVLAPAFVADLQDASAVVVVAVAAQDIGSFANFSELVADVVQELRRDAGLRFGGGIAIWVNGNKIPTPKTENPS